VNQRVAGHLNSERKDLDYLNKYYLHTDKIYGITNDISASIVREELKIYKPDNHELITEAILN